MILRHFKIRQGHWRSNATAPAQHIFTGHTAESAALLGADFPHLRPVYEVAQESRVRAGQVLFRDRRHPQIAHVAPIGGTLTQIDYGPRRTLSACIVEHDPAVKALPQTGALDLSTPALVRETLLDRGMWPAFRTRPFNCTPDPNARPAAIFVTATQASPTAPDPAVVLGGRIIAFRHGIAVLTQLTDGIIHVCQSEGDALCVPGDRVQVSVFTGTRASGLASTHIDRLHPVHSGDQVWTIGYQDVAAIGHLFQTGQYFADRVVSIAGKHVKDPKLIRTCLGAAIHDAVADEIGQRDKTTNLRFLSGDEFTGYEAAFLGRFDQQITLADKPIPRKPHHWWPRLFARQGALVPTTALERALAVDILPVPLMRALSVGDSEAAARLGCAALVEEDIAILSRMCTSGADYGALLRQVLDQLAKEVA